MTISSIVKNKLKWDEPLGLTTITTTVTGSFVTIAPPQGYRNFFYYLSWYHLAMFAIFMMNAVLKVFTATDFFTESIESLRFLVTGVHIASKHLTMRRREKQFLELFEQIRAAWRTSQQGNKDFLFKSLASVNKSSIVIILVVFNTVYTNILGAIAKNLGGPKEIQYPLLMWVPAPLRTSFVAGTLYQLVPYISPMLIYCSILAFLNSITGHVEALGLAVVRDIKRLKVWEGEESRALYKKHQEVVRIVHRVNALMGSNWGFEMMCSTLQLTLVAFNALRNLKKGNNIEFVNQGVLLLVNFLVIYLIYGNGNRIIKMGEKMHASLYETNWDESSIKEKKNILFMMLRTTYPMEYRYKIIRFDLPGFAKVVNTVFSYITLLRSIDERADTGGS